MKTDNVKATPLFSLNYRNEINVNVYSVCFAYTHTLDLENELTMKAESRGFVFGGELPVNTSTLDGCRQLQSSVFLLCVC